MKRAASTKCVVWWSLGALLVAGCSDAGPSLLASGQDRPWSVAVQDGTVYWVDLGGSVMSVPAGGGTPKVLVSGPSLPSSIAVDGKNVYFTDSGSVSCGTVIDACGATPDGAVSSVPLTGGAATILAGGLCTPDSVAVDATDLYVVEAGAGNILRVPIAGGAPTKLATGQTLPGSIAVDATSVYWTVTDRSSGRAALMTLPKSGGAPLLLASGWSATFTGGPCGATRRSLGVHGGRAYWIAGGLDGPSSVMTVDTGGGTPTELTTLGPPGESPDGVLGLDEANAYYSAGDAFHKIPLAGGAATTIAVFDGVGGGQPDGLPGDFALESGTLYWTDSSGHVASTPTSP